MSKEITPILLVSDDKDLTTVVSSMFSKEDGYRLTAREDTLSSMNGTAVSLASQHHVILYDTDASSAEDLAALQKVSDGRATNALIVAITTDDLTLAQSRKLSRAGADDVIPRSCLEEDLAKQVENWRVRKAAQLPAVWLGKATQGKILAVTGSRGGVGKSTLAVNLADAMQNKKGFRRKEASASVAILDLDLQFGSVATLLDVEENDGIYRMAMDGSIPDRDYIQNCIVKSASGITVMPAPTRFTPLDALKSEQVSAILDQLCRDYDYVVVDMPSALVSWMEPVLNRADRLFLASDVTVPAVRNCRKLIDFYTAESPNIDIEVVVTMEKKPLFMSQHHKEATKLLERDFLHWVPLDAKPARETLDRGKTVFDLAPRSPLAKAIRTLAADTTRDLPSRSAPHAS
ncbi:AAA family ATPase [Roseobacter ponti]|uniref:P-loop NTPase n=1 Tax=Roseobacter ponti TaxID=1891787 RepID=A0A858SWF5_9RHOB|nr:P-loop NTPase [Roseobacter ponti]QJF51801.1 P-loop NTPase [Roseobacter ponti]